MSGRLENKVAVITGAASGQGAAAARLFAAEGARVAAFDINESSLRQLDINSAQLLPVVCDATDAASVQAGVSRVHEQFGTVDALYNNAGTINRRPGPWDDTQDGPVADITEAVFDHSIAVNLKSQFLMCKYVIPYMRAAGGGAIVNVSSLGGPFIGTQNNAYCTAKAGVVGLTKSLALSYGAEGIRSNAICPGVVETPLVEHILEDEQYRTSYTGAHPMGRFGQPAEMASVGLFLASDDAAYVNGEVITADGGFMIRPK